jgi:hypothetical protein
VTEVFPEWKAPSQACPLHSPWGSTPWQEADLGAGYGVGMQPGDRYFGGVEGAEGAVWQLPSDSTVEIGVEPAAGDLDGLNDQTGGGTIVLRPSRGTREPVLGVTEPVLEGEPEPGVEEGDDIVVPIEPAVAPEAGEEAPEPAWIGFEDEEDWSQDGSPPPPAVERP